MKVDAHSSTHSINSYHDSASIKHGGSSPLQAAAQQHLQGDAGLLEKDNPTSSIKPADPSGSVREDQKRLSQQELSAQDKKVVDQLKARDREVRAHEAAHKGAAGSLARGGATFSYQSGPDGHRYAIGGEVSIDTSEVPDNPQATIIKAQIIYRAAMAPAQPSSQDRSVATNAKQMEAQAQQELRQDKIEEQKTTETSNESSTDSEPPI